MPYNLKISIFYKIYDTNKTLGYNSKTSNLDYRTAHYGVVYFTHLRGYPIAFWQNFMKYGIVEIVFRV
jgi:hypothetical protein